MTYITKDDPAFLVQKGDQDCTIAIENTKMLADTLAAVGMDVHYDLLKGVGHGDGFGDTTPVFESESNSQALVDFLNTKLKAQPTAPPAAAANASVPTTAAPTAIPAAGAAAAAPTQSRCPWPRPRRRPDCH